MNKQGIQPIAQMKAKQDLSACAYYTLPAARVIGKGFRCLLDKSAPNPIPAFWGKCADEGLFETIKAPARMMPAMLGFTDDYDGKTNTFLYIVGALFDISTPVPEGYIYRDIPATVVFMGKYGQWLDEARPVWTQDGFRWSGEEGQYWNAELYLDGENTDGYRLLCAVTDK